MDDGDVDQRRFVHVQSDAAHVDGIVANVVCVGGGISSIVVVVTIKTVVGITVDLTIDADRRIGGGIGRR